MGKFKQFLKVNYKGVIVGIIIGVVIASTTTYAVTVAGNAVTYDNTSSGLISTNVQGAIDEVYSKANSCNISLKELGNSNIVSVKKYDETSGSSTYCVLGTEATCQSLTPAKTGIYAQGTIVDYKVNDNTIETFYVLHDDGTTLTMQTKKNIVDNVAYATKEDFIAAGGTEIEWNDCTNNGNIEGCNDRGPLTILPTLESAINSWTNVNLQTYTPGITKFLDNNKTGCVYWSCTVDTYAIGERSARARLITVPEVWATGCQTWQNRTCPKYMYNYIKDASEYGGVEDGNETSYGYWTMNANSGTSSRAWYLDGKGTIESFKVLGTYYGGARAVVEINK